MRILIVDDTNNKAANIKDACKTLNYINEENIVIVTSILDAIEKMKTEKFQLLITDLCIPESYGSELIDDGGLRIIQIIKSNKKIYAPNEVILLSSYEELINKYREDIKKESFDIIYHNDSSVEWKNSVLNKVKYLHRYELSQFNIRSYIYDVAIITTTQIEKDSINELSDNWEKIDIPGDSTNYYKTDWKNENKNIKIITTNLTQMGMVAAATMTSKIIYNFAPKYIVITGIAGGVKCEYNYGDIVIPKEVKDYCSGKFTTPQNIDETEITNPFDFFIPSSPSIPTDVDIINLISENYDNELYSIYSSYKDKDKYTIPKIRTGNMATGDSVIQNEIVLNTMINRFLRNADGVDMETYGMYYAAHNASQPKPKPICIKAISDFANKEKNDDHQAFAAHMSAQFTKYFIINKLF